MRLKQRVCHSGRRQGPGDPLRDANGCLERCFDLGRYVWDGLVGRTLRPKRVSLREGRLELEPVLGHWQELVAYQR